MNKSNEQEPLIPFVNVDGLLNVNLEQDEYDYSIEEIHKQDEKEYNEQFKKLFSNLVR